MYASYVSGPDDGYGILHINGAGDVSQRPNCRLWRASDGMCLGRAGWQPEAADLPLRGAAGTEEGCALSLGPEATGNLVPGEAYTVEFNGADGKEHSLVLNFGNAGYPEALPSDSILSLPPDQARPQRGRAWAPVALLLLLCLGAAFWALRSGVDKPVESGKMQTPPAQSGKAQTPPAQSGSVSPRVPSAVLTPLQRARAHLSGPADAPTSLAMAKEFRPLEDGADAAFLLAEDAAQKGLPEAMLIAGSFYDPLDAQPRGTIIIDPVEAMNWYVQAGAAGIAGARERVAALRGWLRAQSAAGNAEAERILKTF
ncbi:MAG: hypothetical protein LBS65_10555 [Desulfovibrio sp.]|nr:hypothetical protein [Desulfovibrio sp.]